MLLRYFYDQNLAQASYLVGCQETGEAIVIDPSRHVDQYLELAEAEEMRIIAAAETHIHADFVSGARELAHRTGASLYLSDNGDKNWKYLYTGGYPSQRLYHESLFNIGNLAFQALHTPGHTPEHVSFLMTDTMAADKPMGIFSGDFIFVGDVGRPDLLEKAAGVVDSAEYGARQMFASLKEFKKLPDYLQVWPGHGAGSACGRNLGAVPSTTLGYEKLFSWAFNIDDESVFVKELLREQPEPPYYFSAMKRINKEGPPLLSTVPTPERLPSARLESILSDGYPVIDTRTAGAFAASHIPGTLNIPHDSSFTQWAGWLIGFDIPYYLIVDPPMLDQLHRALVSIGLDRCGGCFEIPVIQAWAASGNELECYSSVFPSQLVDQFFGGDICLVDVRSLSEWNEGHIPGAHHIMLGTLKERLNELPNDKPIVLQCRTGVRSAIGASILQANGFSNVINLMGGIREWEAAGYAAA